MNNFGLPADAAYTPDGAISFKKNPSVAAQEETLQLLLDLKNQLTALRNEVKELKESGTPTSKETVDPEN